MDTVPNLSRFEKFPLAQKLHQTSVQLPAPASKSMLAGKAIGQAVPKSARRVRQSPESKKPGTIPGFPSF
jgi:hypothetical protein